MKTLLKILIVTQSLIILIPPLFAQESNDIKFEYAFDIGGEPCFAIIQDRDGFMWFSSFFNGLLRYDGSSLKKYREGSGSISSDFVTQLFEDSNGYIWAGTNAGLNKYDKNTNTFTIYTKDSQKPNQTLANNTFNLSSNTIVEDQEGLLWFGTQSGLSYFDKHTEKFTNFWHDPNDPNSLSGNDIYSVFLDSEGFIWIGTKHSGANKYDKKTGKFTRFQHSSDDPNSLPNNDIQAIIEDQQGFIWFGSRSNGLIRYDKKTNHFTHFKHNPSYSTSLPQMSISDLYLKQDGKIAVIPSTSAVGLILFDPKNGTYQQQHKKPGNPFSLTTDTVQDVFEDRDGTLWVVHNNGKVDKHDPKAHRFNLYKHNPLNPKSLASNAPVPVFEDSKGNIWIGHFGAGLDRYNPETDDFTHFKPDSNNPKTLPHGYPAGFFEDEKGDFIVSTANGMVLFDQERGEVKQRISQDTWFYTIIQDSDEPDILWTVGWEQSFNRYNRKTGDRKIYKHDPTNPDSFSAVTSVRFIKDRDEPDIMWIATWGGGLEKFDKRTEKFSHHRYDKNNQTSISSDTVFDVYEDSKGKFWVCTDRGLNKFDKHKKIFKRFNKTHGFEAKIVHNVLEDKNGKLWFGTNIGLILFDPDKEQVLKVYTVEDGLHSHDFFPTARGQTRDGKLWFGGFNGLNSFFPEQLTENKTEPQVFLTAIKQNGKELKLDVAFEKLKKLTLDWRQNFFEFEYVALNYTNSSKNSYQYFLEGYDKHWYHAGIQRLGRYTSLPGGNYVLRIRGSNNDGVWSRPEQEMSLAIYVATPPWQTWWAYVLYAVIILGGIIGIFIMQQRKLAISSAINEQLQQADKLKDEFLANTSHELRTPLNGIIGIAESMLDGATGKLTENTHKNLAMIVSSGRRLSNLVNDILDFSRLKHKELELQLKPISLHEIVDVILMLNQPLLLGKQVELINSIDADLPPVLADENRLQQILHNLIGNGIKFTETGKVEVLAQVSGDNLRITVADTGIGIPADKLERIFKSFEQAEGSTAREYGGTGLGLAITKHLVQLHGGKIWATSKQEEGSQFNLTLSIAEGQANKLSMEAEHLSKIENIQVEENVATEVKQTSNQLCILTVDDELVNLQVLNNYLSLQNYRIVQASSGSEALAIMEDGFLPDAILLDVMMPKMTGYEVTQKLREKWSIDELPILLLTAKNQVTDLVIGLQAGASDYLTKPVSKDELLARLKTHLNIKHLKAENIRMSTELDVSRRLQQMLLPSSNELSKIENLDIAGFMEPAAEVGGDYYDVQQVGNRIFCGIGDVTGHGLESGVLAIMTQTAVKTLLANNETDYVKFLTALNETIYDNVQRMNCDKSLTFALLDYQNGQIRLTGQHEEVIVVRQGELELIDTIDLGFPIGLDNNISNFISEAKISLNTGDVLVLYTDGITEAENIDKEYYGLDRLCEIVKQNWQRTAQEIQEAVISDVKEFIGQQEVFDDITLLVLKQK
ncbi:two-component regulator propeller domain-containing protein [Candidatus Halobeggiatoa sp. HSG11]|nr:two-component regulator propeller domain-containing protein [Candidatus Halobeggiatoa sp. HSG11]